MQTCSDSTRKPKKKTYEQEALERTGKWNTNGPNMTIPRCTRQSFLIVLQSLTSFTNTLTEIGHGHLLGRICFESMTTLGVECYFKGMRLAYSGSLRLQKSALRGIRYAAHLSVGFPIFYWAQFILTGENYQNKSKVNPQTSRCDQTSSQQSRRHLRRETVMREFAGEYGRDVRQENVRSKAPPSAC